MVQELVNATQKMSLYESTWSSTNFGSSVGKEWSKLTVAHWRTPPQENDLPPISDHALVLVLRGSLHVSYRLDGGKRKGGWTRPGGLSFWPAGTASSWRLSDVGESIQIYIPPKVIASSGRAAFKSDISRVGLPDFPVKFDREIERYGKALLRQLYTPAATGGLYADIVSQALVVQFLRSFTSAVSARAVRDGRLNARQLRHVIDYVDAHLDEDVRLSELAHIAGVSNLHFPKAFQRSTGVSPYRFVMEQRVGRARQLLAETDDPIAQVAYAVGFSSQSHLTTVFKSLVGATPGAFRKSL